MIDFVKMQDASSDINDFVTQYTNYCRDMIQDLLALEEIVSSHNSSLRQEIHQLISDYSNMSREVTTSCKTISMNLNQYVLDSKQNLLNLTNDFSNITKEFGADFSSIDSL